MSDSQKMSAFTAQTSEDIAVAGTDDYLGGYTTANGVTANRKFSMANVGNWILDKFKLSLNGTNQTVAEAFEELDGGLDDKVDKVTGKGLSTNDYTNDEKTKLASIASGAEVNVNADWNATGGDAQILNKPTTIAGYGITDAYTKSEINAKIASTYKPGGSLAFASLPALTASNLGYVYNITDAFTTTSDFVEGSGKSHPAGTNVAIVDVGSSTYKYDVLAGFVDLSGYVQKETGKGLSTNDYTTNDKNKLDGIEAGAEVNVNPDWNATSGDGKILNKPTTISGYGITDAYTKTQTDTALGGKVDKVNGKGLSTNDYTTEEKNKLGGIAAGAEVNVNPDWNATSGDGEILHKPTSIAGYGITDAYTKSETDTALSALNSAKVDKVQGKGLSTNDYTNTDSQAVQTFINTGLSVIDGMLQVTYTE